MIQGQRKPYLSYADQVQLLTDRGMQVDDPSAAATLLSRINYYRLSGYWYPFRLEAPDGSHRLDQFLPNTKFDDVVRLYNFDARLRATVFNVLGPVELAFRALLGHELGRIDPHAHLRVDLLGPRARRQRSSDASQEYLRWKRKYEDELNRSREDFVQHHRNRYGGMLPVWAAVEVLDWGKLTYLYGLAPSLVRDRISSRLALSSPQTESWLKVLNVLRNHAAHHGRLFNRVFSLTPRLPRGGRLPELSRFSNVMNRAFGQLTLIQYLLTKLDLEGIGLLPDVLRSFPDTGVVPLAHTGAPQDWAEHPLWVTSSPAAAGAAATKLRAGRPR